MKQRAIHNVWKLVLPARIAASRFLFACRPRARGSGWRAARLIWRRTRKLTRSLQSSRATLLRAIWAPQLHLHFSVQAGERSAEALSATNSSPNMIRPLRQQFIRNRCQTNVRILATAPPIPPGLHSLQIIYRRSSVPKAARMLGPRRPQPLILVLPTLPSHRICLSEKQRRTPFVLQTERTLAKKTLALNTTEHQHNTRELRFRAVVAANAVRPRSFRRQPRQPQTAHIPELVWRRMTQPPSPDVENQARPASATLTPSSFRSHRATTTVSPEPPILASAQTQPPNLDTGFMDRLTEDVIRRVEKRVRIERERRGL
jgi:hypothetical protein